MAGPLHLEVATPLGRAVVADVESVEAPSVDGEFGVLPGHLPLLAALRPGLLRYRTHDAEEVAAIGPGFVEVSSDRVLVLTDLFAKPSEIRAEDARQELATAESELARLEGPHEGPRYDELRRASDWARARLDALEWSTRVGV